MFCRDEVAVVRGRYPGYIASNGYPTSTPRKPCSHPAFVVVVAKPWMSPNDLGSLAMSQTETLPSLVNVVTAGRTHLLRCKSLTLLLSDHRSILKLCVIVIPHAEDLLLPFYITGFVVTPSRVEKVETTIVLT
jgi:hypothetical protein